MLNFELLRAFVAVANAGGFHRAAERLDLAQSTISQASVRRLANTTSRRRARSCSGPFDGGDDALGEVAGEGDREIAVLAAIGQPMARADHHRITKSFRQPILKNVNAPLTTKTIMAVITTGKANLALPSMHLSETLH